MTSPVDSTIVRSEPVMAGAITTWLLAQVGLILAHYNLLGGLKWSSASELIAAPVSGVILLGIGWAVRHLVTPVTKLINLEATGIAPFAADEFVPPAPADPAPAAADPLTVALDTPTPVVAPTVQINSGDFTKVLDGITRNLVSGAKKSASDQPPALATASPITFKTGA